MRNFTLWIVLGTFQAVACSSGATASGPEGSAQPAEQANPPLATTAAPQAGSLAPQASGPREQAPSLPQQPTPFDPPSVGSESEAPLPLTPSEDPAPGVKLEQAAKPVEEGPRFFADPQLPEITETCPSFESGTISFMGLRGIRVVAGPKAAEPTAPIVFYWHGTGSTSGEFAFMASAVRDGVEAEGGVLISFQGTTGGDALSGTATFGRGDFALVDQLAACAVRDHNVDPRRIFTTGCSAGGLFATALGVLRSNYIAAIAPNSGGLVFRQEFQGDFTPPLMTMHGASGRDVVIVNFSRTSRTADQLFSARGGFVINCNHGGGHCGAGALSGDVWEFFSAHPYGLEPAPSPWTEGLPEGFDSDCELFQE